MTRTELKIAGCLAMISAFVTVPLTYFMSRFDHAVDRDTMVLQAGIEVAGAALFVVLALYLKKMLGAVFGFRAADKTIDYLIIANCVSCCLSLVSFTVPHLQNAFDTVAIVLVIAQGFLQIQLGYVFLKFPHDLDGMQKPFSYLNMITGVCMASVLLVVVGVVVSAISDLMLGTIFFYVARIAVARSGGKPAA